MFIEKGQIPFRVPRSISVKGLFLTEHAPAKVRRQPRYGFAVFLQAARFSFRERFAAFSGSTCSDAVQRHPQRSRKAAFATGSIAWRARVY